MLLKKIAIVFCLFCIIAGGFAYQNYSNQKVFQAINGWQGKIDVAKIDGKSPAQVSAFLTKCHATQEPYTGVQSVLNESTNTRQNEGFILAEDPSAVAYTLGLPEGHSWSIKMCFTFDDHNRCINSYVSGQGS